MKKSEFYANKWRLNISYNSFFEEKKSNSLLHSRNFGVILSEATVITELDDAGTENIVEKWILKKIIKIEYFLQFMI